MATRVLESCTVADAYLALLADRGVEYFFANAGTDFAPLIEAFAKAQALGTPAPKPVTVPHENVTVALAMGYTMVTGRPQAVMLHTTVGTANGICQVLNSYRLNLPMLFSAGRTPWTEEGVTGGRSIDIHWTQEMFDQGGMLREATKWDYELRNAQQLESVVDRALNLTRAQPCGPVYLTLPREVLAQPLDRFAFDSPARHADALPPHPDANAVDRLAALLTAAERPVIVATQLGSDHAAVAALGALADALAIPVAMHRPRTLCLPADHPMHVGYAAGPWLKDADLVIAVEASAPWIPSRESPPADAAVVHVGVDPLFSTHPIRGFPCDLAVAGAAAATLTALAAAIDTAQPALRDRIARRRARVAERQAMRQAALAQKLEQAARQTPMHPAWVSHCLNEVKGEDAIVMMESPLDLDYARFNRPGTVFVGASGLGWGLGGALGAKLAAPDRLVIATEGDGAYMYGNPVSSHYVSEALGLPFLTVIFNNRSWHAVRQSTRGLYPDGYAARSNAEPLTDLEPSPRFERVVAASDGYGERVEDPAEMPAALQRALKAVREEKRQAVLNVICAAV
ncbi:MAG: thiamine pyrophosphate-requiring protein [Rhodospirillales bacterium]